MSCFERDIIEGHESVARNICDFLYINGKGNNGFQSHTEDEYRVFLKELADSEFDTYNDAARRMGWV